MEPQEKAANSPAELQDFLFGQADTGLFAVLDGAASPGLVKSLYEFEPDYACLHRGELPPDRAVVAPYLVRLERRSPFAEWLFNEGWGNHWGIFLVTNATLRTLRDHCRKFLTVELPDQRVVQFRFYDPRVLRGFLPACNAEELGQFFGPVATFMTEAEAQDCGISLSFVADKLKVESRKLKPRT